MIKLNLNFHLFFSLLAVFAFKPVLLTAQLTTEQGNVVRKGYQLVWFDDFTNAGIPDTSRWVFETGNGQDGWGNQEHEYYTARPENVSCQDGNLVITAIKEPYKGLDYTSARMKTTGKFTFTYSLIEFRAKLPGGTGIWPALWLLGNNIDDVGWPACGEIDVMEYAGKNPNLIHGSIHNNSSYGGTIHTKTKIFQGVEEEFHIYSVEWTEKEIRFMVDGDNFYTYKPSEYNTDTWPFDKPFFIIMNIAVGGGFGGPVVDDEIFPQSMVVDYVRVYQKTKRLSGQPNH
jgi:beta-glucanase (GH16 family)